MNTHSKLQPAFFSRAVLRSLVLVAALAAAGCVSTAGIKHDQTLAEPAALGARASFDAWPQADWWKTLNDSQLNQLIAQALQANPNVILASKRLEKAQAAASSANATLYPQLTGSADVSRQRLSENSFYPPPFAGSYQTLANASLNAAWDLDFWGKNRSALNAALSQAQAQQAEQAAARLMVSTAVARTYYQLAKQLEQQKLAQQALTQREQELKLVQDRIATGLDTNVELNQGQQALFAAKVELETSNEAIALTRNALAALTAQAADRVQTLAPQLPSAEIYASPESTPVDIIAKRPDLTAAKARVDAATAGVASAKAEFYPNISLSAFIGLSSFGLSHFLDLGSTVLGAGPALHLPIFDVGRLRANLKSNNADLDIAVASYNQTLLESIHDVADQITSLSTVHKQTADQQVALDAAESAYRLAGLRYKEGLSNYLTVLSAADNVLRERSNALALRARKLDINLALIKSLGGGYDAPQPQSESSTIHTSKAEHHG